MSSSEGPEPRDTQQLANRPDEKLSRIPKGFRIQKRPLPALPTGRLSRRDPDPSSTPADLDGYRMPPRAAHTTVIKVTSKSPFMAIVKRVRKVLDNPPQPTKGLPLTARIAALGVRGATGEGGGTVVGDALDDVVLVATGRAISKALEVGAFFRRTNKEVMVLFRTRTVSAIDDIVLEDDADADEEDQVRVRQLSCVEVGLRWRK
ncbi:ribonucleases P/MRP protein subunit POP7 [Echria macrotheca]|uniref:Ribonucleases P/MRP protein subunit POP7 n=1 Tax=Echria macrotheca TaxID=438768 RepID=A0AAJ0BHJ5_9PEZI|nr:ribonucleases P/MRP protein subunit POP7 [Echria macrotheca]